MYEAFEGEELKTMEDFKLLFKDKFMKEEINEDRLDRFMKLYVEGPDEGDLLIYAYDMKKYAPKTEDFTQCAIKAVKRYIPQTLELASEKIMNWSELFEFL